MLNCYERFVESSGLNKLLWCRMEEWGWSQDGKQSTIFMVTLRQCRRYTCDISVSRGTF